MLLSVYPYLSRVEVCLSECAAQLIIYNYASFFFTTFFLLEDLYAPAFLIAFIPFAYAPCGVFLYPKPDGLDVCCTGGRGVLADGVGADGGVPAANGAIKYLFPELRLLDLLKCLAPSPRRSIFAPWIFSSPNEPSEEKFFLAFLVRSVRWLFGLFTRLTEPFLAALRT